ncbi:MAG: heavy metal-associated domain-containing protein, partial [archaeon]
MKTELNLEIKGMHCKSCAELIKSHLSGLDGIESADASYAEERAKIRFDSDKISQEKIEEEIN